MSSQTISSSIHDVLPVPFRQFASLLGPLVSSLGESGCSPLRYRSGAVAVLAAEKLLPRDYWSFSKAGAQYVSGGFQQPAVPTLLSNSWKCGRGGSWQPPPSQSLETFPCAPRDRGWSSLV